ncbi:MAG: FAD-dependent oxidoreductase, partial [Bradymonadaceae bacterium]
VMPPVNVRPVAEAAAAFRTRDLDVSVVSMDTEPFEGSLGTAVGRSFRKLHRENGVEFALETGVERLEGDGSVDRVVLEDGSELEADFVLVGVGVTPATSFVEGLERTQTGAIEVDRRMRARKDIYAAGDIARFPDPRTLRRVRIEHWRTASQLGKVAAMNMVGEETEYDEVPFFWTRQYGTSYKYVGHADQWEDVIIDGDLDERDYIAYYVDGEDVLAAVGTRGHALTHLHAMMRHEEMPTTDDLVGGFDVT